MTWEQLVTEHHAKVFRIALGIVRDRAAAEDVVQDVYLDLLRRPGALDRADDPAAFIGRCAVNRALKAVRGSDRRQKHEVAAAGGEARMTTSPEEAEFRREIREKVAELPEEQRVVLSLHYFSGMAVSEVAAVLEVPQGTAASRLSAGLGRLRKALASVAFAALLMSLERHLEGCEVEGPDPALSRRLLDLPKSVPTAPAVRGRTGSMKLTVLGVVALLGIACFLVAPRAYKSWREARRRAEQEAAVASFVPEAVIQHRKEWQAAESAITADARVRLDAADRETEVHGIVVRDDMTPLGGVVLRASFRPWGDLLPRRMDEDAPEPGPSTRSADDGTFALKLAPGAGTTLHVAAPGRPEFFMEEIHAGERMLVVVPRGSKISILAKTKDGLPVPGVVFRVGASQEKGNVATDIKGTTGADGVVNFDLPGGCWGMIIADRGDAGELKGKIWFEPGGVARREVVVDGGRSIDGRVLDAETALPIAGARIRLGSEGLRKATTDVEGRFHISAWTDEGLPKAELFAAAEGYASVHVVPKGTEPVELKLLHGVTLTGRIVDAAGAPVGGAKVFAETDSNHAFETPSRSLSGADGRFALAGLPAGVPLFVQAASSGHGRVFRRAGAPKGSTHDLGDLALPGGRTVSGRALAANGTPLPRAELIIHARIEMMSQFTEAGDVLQGAPMRITRADDLGRYSFSDVAPGPYEITMESAGMAGVEKEFEVPADQDVTLDISPPQSRLRTVVLTDQDGKPVADFEFMVIDTTGFHLETDSNGRATFPSTRARPSIDLTPNGHSLTGPSYIWDRSGTFFDYWMEEAQTEIHITGVRAEMVKGEFISDAGLASWDRDFRVMIEGESWGKADVNDDGTFEAYVPEGRMADLVLAPVGKGAELYAGRVNGVKGGQKGVRFEASKVSKTGSMRVRVLDGAAPAAGAVVEIVGPCGRVATGKCGPDGTILFENLPVVPLRAVAEAEGALAELRLPGASSGITPDGREVTLVLTPCVTVTGIVTDVEGQPADDATVHVEVDGETAVTVRADKTGRFIVRASADSTRKQVIRATAPYPRREGRAEVTAGEVRIVMEAK